MGIGIGTKRGQAAIDAALSIASQYAVAAARPTILHDSNHTIIHLAPAPLVAKVNTSLENASFAMELRVATYLVAKGAAVVPPTSMFPPGPYVHSGLEVTFWEYCPSASTDVDPDTMGAALHALHAALADYPGPLPAWGEFDGIERVLYDPAALAALPHDERAFLRTTYCDLLASIAAFDFSQRPLHGEPHDGNLLLTPNGPRWIDFESACRGPLEWDLTVLDDDIVQRHFEGVDYRLLGILKRMRSLCVATWCWLDPDRDPVLRETGHFHLSRLHIADPDLERGT